MASFPEVTSGEAFQPNAVFHNNLVRLVNAQNGFSAKGNTAVGIRHTVPVYNSGDDTLKGGTAVNFSSESGAEFAGDAVPVVKFKNADIPYGILVNDLKAGEFGTVIIAGTVKIAFAGTQGDFVQPKVQSADTAPAFESASTGMQVLFTDGTYSLVNMSAPGGAADEYNGYFKIVKVSERSIKIVDGATYDPITKQSGGSYAYTNNVISDKIEDFSHTPDAAGSSYYFIKYLPELKDEEGNIAQLSTIEIIASTEMLSETQVINTEDSYAEKCVYYFLGRVFFKERETANGTEKVMQIVQDHKSGIAKIYFFSVCN